MFSLIYLQLIQFISSDKSRVNYAKLEALLGISFVQTMNVATIGKYLSLYTGLEPKGVDASVIAIFTISTICLLNYFCLCVSSPKTSTSYK